jgi:DNA-directed RNA polymerase specialized sigma subunit
MKTKSIRALVSDAEKIEQASRELSAELQKRVTVSQIVNKLMECLEDAKEAIKKENDGTS